MDNHDAWDFSDSYTQYFPDLVEKWRSGQHAKVASALLQHPKYYVSTFCVDLVMALQGSKDYKLSTIAAALLEAEESEDDLWEMKNTVEELCKIWGENTHEAFQRVGMQLKESPRAVVVAFASTLFDPQAKMQSLTMLGILTGSLI